MGRAAGVSRRRSKNKNPRFKGKTKLKKEKAKIHRVVKIENECVRQNWDKSKTVQENMEQMGLVYDPNKIIGLPKPYKGLGLPDPQEMEEVDVNDIDEILQLGKKKKEEKKKTKKHVVEQLEKEASIQPPKLFKFGPEVSKFIVKMIEKHGADFQAMQRDSANRYQYSAGQIRSLIKKFMNIPTNRRAYERVVQNAEQEEMSTE